MPDHSPVAHVHPLVMLDEVDSTNAEAQRRAAAGERGPLWICANQQSQGRGRSGRSWGSPPGSLAATLLFRPGCSAVHLPELGLVAAVAVVDALSTIAADHRVALDLRLKWPNDVLLGGAKVSGILVECGTWGDDLVAMIGIGINIAARPAIKGRAVTSLAEHGLTTTPAALGRVLADVSHQRLQTWQAGAGFPAIRQAWLQHSLPTGEPIAINAGEGPVSGTFAGLDADGALLLEDRMGQRRRFSFGDVTLPRVEA